MKRLNCLIWKNQHILIYVGHESVVLQISVKAHYRVLLNSKALTIKHYRMLR
jgi:hypothetical protein